RLPEVELGSGESSVQWAVDSNTLNPVPATIPANPAEAPLSEFKQAWRMNESLGTFFTDGGNKFMWWSMDFAPGQGWPWRWGFRKYEDLWGIWPDSYKIPNTQIVYRWEEQGKPPVDLRPAWSEPSNPWHPVWES